MANLATRVCYTGEGIAIRREMGDRVWLARALEGVAALAASQGDSFTAARTWGAAERLREETGSPSSPNERPRNDRYATMARAAAADEAAFDRAWRQGREMPLDEAIELAFGPTIAQQSRFARHDSRRAEESVDPTECERAWTLRRSLRVWSSYWRGLTEVCWHNSKETILKRAKRPRANPLLG